MGELGQCTAGICIMHPATGNDHRLFGRLDCGNRRVKLIQIGARALGFPDFGVKETFGPVKCLRLHILTECQCHRAAIGRIGQGCHRTWQGGQKLLGAHDAVKITADRLKTIIGRNRAITEILDLLQHRIRCAIGKHIPGHKQNRQTVDMREGRGGHHIGRTRPDRCRDRHGTLAVRCLGVCNGGMGHALLVMTAPGREIIPDAMQCLAHSGNIAMTENRPASAKKRHTVLVLLFAQIPHHRLGGG